MHVFETFKLASFLRSMPNLTNLELSTSHSELVATRDEDLFLPALRSLALTGIHATSGLLRFVARHPLLNTLCLDFENWNLSLEEKMMIFEMLKLNFMELRAPIFDNNSSPFISQSLLGPCLKHIRITNIRYEYSLLAKMQPIGWRLQYLDLHFLSRDMAFGDWFITLMESFVSLVQLSVTLERERPKIENGELFDPELPFDDLWHDQQNALSRDFLVRLPCHFKQCYHQNPHSPRCVR